MARLSLDWVHVIILLGAIQGVFLAGVLAARRRNRTANRLLAAVMMAFSIGLATSVYHAVGWVPVFPHFFGVAYPLPFLYGPLIYLYAVTAADRYQELGWHDALHLVPFVATVIVGLPIYMKSGPEKVAFYQGLLRGEVPPWFAVADVLKLVSGIAYSALTIVFLRQHRERVKESYSSTERVNLAWLLWLGVAAATIWLMAVVVHVLDSAHMIKGAPGDDVISVAVAVVVYGIGYMALRQPEIFRYETAEYPVPRQPSPESSGPRIAAPSYERSGMTDRQAERLRIALLVIMEQEQPWRDSELTLADLAMQLQTTPQKLAEVLNTLIGQTFYDFVNGYRVREVQRRIDAGEAERVKLQALAREAGFSSKSTFNVAFRKHTSRTPSNYQQAAGA